MIENFETRQVSDEDACACPLGQSVGEVAVSCFVLAHQLHQRHALEHSALEGKGMPDTTPAVSGCLGNFGALFCRPLSLHFLSVPHPPTMLRYSSVLAIESHPATNSIFQTRTRSQQAGAKTRSSVRSGL